MMCGKPLIYWTIAAAQSAHSLDEIVVTTDDEEIADIALSMGISVPFLRPTELAQDDTPGIEPILHALSFVEGFDSVLLLQPTSPLRTSADIDAIIAMAVAERATSAVSVCETKEPIHWSYTIQEDGRLKALLDSDQILRRQDAPNNYTLNGALYYFEGPGALAHKTFVNSETIAYVMPPERSIDIDTMFDWMVAEFLLEKEASEYGK